MHDFEELLQRLVAVSRRVKDDVATRIAAAELDFEVTIGGYSEKRRRFETYLMPAHQGYTAAGVTDVKSWHVNERSEAMYVAPMPSDEACASIGWIVPTAENFDPVSDGLALLEAQRRTLMPYGSTEIYGVGGYAQLVSIARDGSLYTRILKRWPDVIGERIDICERR